MQQKKKRHGLTAFLIIVLVLCIGYIAFYFYTNRKEDQEFQKIQTQYEKTKDHKQKNADWWWKDVSIDVVGLQKKNPDCVGWIRFDHLKSMPISYPIMNSTYYLHRNFYRQYSFKGCVFEQDQDGTFPAQHGNAIVYGHNMRDGSMFGMLKHYDYAGVWKKNQYFTVYGKKTAYRYRIYSFFTTNDGNWVYNIWNAPCNEYKEHNQKLKEYSDKNTKVDVPENAQTLTLSTCTNHGKQRFTVHAVLVAQHKIAKK